MGINIRRDQYKRLSMALLVTLLLIPYQNCSRSKFSSDATATQYSGNGDAYEGKLTRYSHFDNKCTELGKNGQPLPDRMIYVLGDYPKIKAQLVRENCLDKNVPVDLNISQIQFSGPDGTGDVVYQGVNYQMLAPSGDFDVVAASCPAGRAPLSSPKRVNMLLASQNLTDPAWDPVDGIGVALNGSLAGLPRYQILRDDPNYVDFWRRVGQVRPLQAGRTFAFSFLAKAGTSDWAGFSFYERMDYTFTLSVNLSTGQVRDDGNVGVPSVQTVSRVFGGGRFITIYFTTTGPVSYGALGVYPSVATGQPYKFGDSISATAVQLEDVSTFCAP
jgi:hypothetical protein